MSAAVAARMFSPAAAPSFWSMNNVTWAEDAKTLDKVKNVMAKDRQRSQNAFWAEVQQRVNKATEKLQARTQAG